MAIFIGGNQVIDRFVVADELFDGCDDGPQRLPCLLLLDALLDCGV